VEERRLRAYGWRTRGSGCRAHVLESVVVEVSGTDCVREGGGGKSERERKEGIKTGNDEIFGF